MDESRIIIDWNEQGDGSYDIRVVGYRNFKQHFSEAFYSIERPMSVFLLATAVSVARLLVIQRQSHF